MILLPHLSSGGKRDCSAKGPGLDSRVGQIAFGCFNQEFLSTSHGVWICAQLMAEGSVYFINITGEM